MYLPKGSTLLCLLILWRLISVFVVQTAHVPDEYWQSLEVAHRLAFGYGYLTWEWRTMIRSYLYPFLISILYRILAAFSLDSPFTLTTLPRVCQAILVGYSDYRFYKWTRCRWSLVMLCINWYWYYSASRTLINSVETACSIIAFSIFPWTHESSPESIRYMWIVGFLCMARPTAAIIWLPLICYHICRRMGNKRWFLVKYAAIGSSCFLISVLVDSYCYGRFVMTPLRFFNVNVMRGVASTYGKENPLWYVTSGLPTLLGLYCIPFAMSTWRIIRHVSIHQRETLMSLLILSTLITYSFISHKEFRFILPLLPLLIHVGSRCDRPSSLRMTSRARWSAAALLVCSNLLPGVYFSLVHQRGTLDVMNHLRDEISSAGRASATDTLVLTPCHATPLYSHLHVNASIRFLTCEPDLDAHSHRAVYVDEADQFFADPSIWLDHRYKEDAALPTHVIAFDNVAATINASFLFRYKMIAKIFHTHFPQTNYGRHILLYKRDTHA